MRPIRHSALCGVLFLAAAVAACSDDDSTGPVDTLNLAGRWSGAATLPNPSSASFTLQQTGTAVSGQMAVSIAFPQGLTLTGTVNTTNRTFAWAVLRGCEAWGGVMNLSADERQMSGVVAINRSGCQPAQSNGTGNLSLSKQ